jgi:dihydroorotase (multifunctional complex type)
MPLEGGRRLLVRGRLLTPVGLVEGTIREEGGRIVEISRAGEGEALDFSGAGMVILPGLIDMHVHLRDELLSYKEDFTSGTSAAAAGGFVLVGDMPNTRPPVNSLARLEERERLAAGKALVDYGLYVGVGPLEGTERLSLGLKVFMTSDYYSDRRGETVEALRYAEQRKGLVVVHAENPRLYREGRLGMEGTPEAEAEAVREICVQGLSRLHLTHLSSRAGLGTVRGATCDTCPHYLLLGGRELGPFAKVHPSIKGKEDSDALLQAIGEGKIQAITSDHAPHLPEEKGDPATAPGGFPGLETALPLLLTLVNKGVLSLERLVELCSTNPARILGLEGFGSLEPGKFCSLTVVDLKAEDEIRAERFHSKSKFTPFEGWKVKGKPVATIVRGRLVMRGGEILEKPGWGKNVRRL